jgi:hypothetical protein
MRAKDRLTAGFLKSPPVGKHCDGAGLWLVAREDGGALMARDKTDFTDRTPLATFATFATRGAL